MQINKLLLFLLLFSGAVYGQDYPNEFTEIEGWNIDGEKQFYGPDNLYDYINGASDFYMGYDFQDLWVVDYKNDKNRLLTLELYRHATPLLAFGIYSEERPSGAKVRPIGAQGFMESGAIFFLAGDYYVKIYNGRPEVSDSNFVVFSERVANKICTECSLPDEFKVFPDEGKIELSERYIPENFMGISGFNGVSTVDYKLNGETFKLFVFKADDASCRSLMKKYFERLKYKKKLKERIYYLDDPYLGKVAIGYRAGVLYGMLDAKTPEELSVVLNNLDSGF